MKGQIHSRKRGKQEEASRGKKELDKFKDIVGIHMAGEQGHLKEFKFILMTTEAVQNLKWGRG